MRETLSPSSPEAGGAYPPPPVAYPPQPTPYPPHPGVYAPPPGPYAPPAPPAGALTVVRPVDPPAVSGGLPPAPDPNDRYRPDPERPSPIWQAIKWPIRKALLGLYYAIQTTRRHKVIALALVVLLVALVGSGVAVYQLTHPTIQPAVPVSVTHFFHGRQTGNVQEMYSSLDPSLQDSNMQSLLQTIVSQDKSQGVSITRYTPVKHYANPEGGEFYVFRVGLSAQGQSGSQLYNFVVGSNGLIQNFGPMIVIGPA
jgi:hypothetical protein